MAFQAYFAVNDRIYVLERIVKWTSNTEGILQT